LTPRRLSINFTLLRVQIVDINPKKPDLSSNITLNTIRFTPIGKTHGTMSKWETLTLPSMKPKLPPSSENHVKTTISSRLSRTGTNIPWDLLRTLDLIKVSLVEQTPKLVLSRARLSTT
jgi:hypothetical protein